jgi:predicted nucleotidyltransferase
MRPNCGASAFSICICSVPPPGGEARTDSDVDLFFDHEWGELSLFDVMEVQEVTARILGRDTDAMTRDSLHPVLRDRIENSAIPVF